MKTFLITGASQGFGLTLARALLDAAPAHQVVLAVRRPEAAPDLGARSRVVRLDLSRLAEVDAFAREWRQPLAGLINNAGVQSVALARTPDGLEETVAVNYLAAVRLTQGLLPHLARGRVLFLGSETHVDTLLGRTMGFRGARFTSLQASLAGEPQLSGADRYATSKMLDTLATIAFSRQVPEVTFLTLDPGMMPGTGLARRRSDFEQWAWKRVLPLLAPLIPGSSTLARSAATAVWLLTSAGLRSGEAWSYARKPARLMSALKDPAWVERVWEETRAAQLQLGGSTPTAAGAPRLPA